MITSPFKYKETPEILKNIKVLIVDDDQLTTSALEMFLISHIPKLITFNSPLSASYYLEKEKIDLLITDYWMEELTGVDLIRIAKKTNPDICTILLTVEDDLPVAEIVNIGVDRYLKKPAMGNSLLEAIEYAIHRIILNRILLEKSKKELELMNLKEKYHEYHQKEAFKKQLNIIKNELKNSTYLKKINLNDSFFYFKSYYKPIEILSGDCYSIRVIGDNRVFLYLFDVMGKGLSASVTAINSASMLNYLINKYSSKNQNSIISKVIEKFLDYIKTIILEEEIICGIFTEFDFNKNIMYYVNFSMPPIFIQANNEKFFLKSTELPISQYTENFSVKKKNFIKFDKILFLSDGIIEAKDKTNHNYLKKIQEDLGESENLKEFLKKAMEHLPEIPDDATIIFLKRINFKGILKKTFRIKSSIDEINKFVNAFCQRLSKTKYFRKLANDCGVVLTEIMLNAHEHGNLTIETNLKENLISSNSYYEEHIKKAEREMDKYINITMVISLKNKKFYVLIEDEGEGFDRYMESTKGVFSTFGLKIVEYMVKDYFFNQKGNQTFLIIDINSSIDRKVFKDVLKDKAYIGF